MAKQLDVSVVTPYKSLFQGAVDSLQLPVDDGLIGIMPGHASMLAKLGVGKLTIRQNTELKAMYVENGFIEVNSDKVTVLASNALTIESIKKDEVIKEHDSILAETAAGDEEIEDKLNRLKATRAKLHLV
ncbi:MAG: ATP synthase F1 subunit epsilon [Leptonema sp. (in: Bacteria)]|nr:ATP synthase F1 subunit epsilon [Leptonema sp. (in: bacteria)]